MIRPNSSCSYMSSGEPAAIQGRGSDSRDWRYKSRSDQMIGLPQRIEKYVLIDILMALGPDKMNIILCLIVSTSSTQPHYILSLL